MTLISRLLYEYLYLVLKHAYYFNIFSQLRSLSKLPVFCWPTRKKNGSGGGFQIASERGNVVYQMWLGFAAMAYGLIRHDRMVLDMMKRWCLSWNWSFIFWCKCDICWSLATLSSLQILEGSQNAQKNMPNKDSRHCEFFYLAVG